MTGYELTGLTVDERAKMYKTASTYLNKYNYIKHRAGNRRIKKYESICKHCLNALKGLKEVKTILGLYEPIDRNSSLVEQTKFYNKLGDLLC